MSSVARQHGLTPFSVYQGRWNAALRDMEAEIIPMCEDQGMAIVPWAALGAGQLLAEEERQRMKDDPGARRAPPPSENHIKVSEALQRIARARDTSIQAVVS